MVLQPISSLCLVNEGMMNFKNLPVPPWKWKYVFCLFIFCFVLFIFFVFRYLEKFTIKLENRSHKTTEGRNFDKRAKKKKRWENSSRLEGMGRVPLMSSQFKALAFDVWSNRFKASCDWFRYSKVERVFETQECEIQKLLLRGSPVGFSGSGISLIWNSGFGVLKQNREEIRD